LVRKEENYIVLLNERNLILDPFQNIKLKKKRKKREEKNSIWCLLKSRGTRFGEALMHLAFVGPSYSSIITKASFVMFIIIRALVAVVLKS